jgi:acyl carrier protein
LEEAEIRERLTTIVADVFKKEPSEITAETRFVEDLRGRSLTMIALIAAVESEFGIKTSARETNRNKTIDDAVVYIQQKLAEKG